MMTPLNMKIEELKGELVVYEVTVEKWGIGVDTQASIDERQVGTAIGTWVEFQNEFRKQFYLEYTEEEAWAKLRQLMQQSIIREYAREFTKLLLQILDLSEKETFYWFKAGLNPRVKQDLHQLGAKELTKAMTEM
ncbi:hypothetical protein PVK06_041363 [Gossypium arboreum]|uniref:Retrotransposon gag domain-containing protein n=1 Tax=Gossypium arboreum TaxID=29729 RepID=A0ABR0NA78_GOSAR|nr:hypothetical protein PVK06_041363 [Gossypium arboreum]